MPHACKSWLQLFSTAAGSQAAIQIIAALLAFSLRVYPSAGETCEFVIDSGQHPEIYAKLVGSVHAVMQGQQRKQAQQQQQQLPMSLVRLSEMDALGLLMSFLMRMRGESEAPADVQDLVKGYLRSAAEQALKSSSSSSSSSSRGASEKQQQQQQGGSSDTLDLVSAGAALINMSMELQVALSTAITKMGLDAPTVKHCALCMTTISNAALETAKEKHQQLLQQQQVPQSQPSRMADADLVINDDYQLPAAYVCGLQEATALAGKSALMYCVTFAQYKPHHADTPVENLPAEELSCAAAEFKAALVANFDLMLEDGPTINPRDFSGSSSSSSVAAAAAAAAAAAGASKPEDWGRTEGFAAGLKGLFKQKVGSSSSSSSSGGGGGSGGGGKAAAAAAGSITSSSSLPTAAGLAGDLTMVQADYWSPLITVNEDYLVRWVLL
jgi:hypothetical protein